MLLTIDAGNTQTVLGLFSDDRDGPLVSHWRISTVRERTADEYGLMLGGLLSQRGLTAEAITGAAVSSVVPPATAALREVLSDMVSGRTVVVEPGIRTGIPIRIDNPREVGADRVVNAVAARERYGSPAVVVDFGTSTNFDVVSPEGDYIGGVIATGVEVSLDALVRQTAALRRVELRSPPSPVGKNTVEAMQSGLIYGHASLVDGIMERIVEELGGEAARVATGGLAPTIVPYCRSVEKVDEFLTLAGLRLIYRRNGDEPS